MRRGPYKLYLERNGGGGVIPRSTFYQKLKNYHRSIPSISDQFVIQDHIDATIDDNQLNDAYLKEQTLNFKQSYNENGTEDDSRLREEPYIEFFEDLNSSSVNEWLHDEYDEETQDREIWFDAESSSVLGNDDNYDENDSNQEHQQPTDNNKDYHEPLCKCTTITRGEALLMTLLLGAEESLTWKVITAILSLINTLFQNDVVPATKYKLFKALHLNEDIITYHLYCSKCLYYFGSQQKVDKTQFVCQDCNVDGNSADVSYFLTFNVSHQLKTILEDSELQPFLSERFGNCHSKPSSNDIRNMSDGQIYKNLSTVNGPLADKFNFSFTFNTDGCQSSKSSKLSIWPIYMCINEFPSKVQSKHMIMAGLWVDTQEPDMQLFLRPFVDQANELSDVGVEWKFQDNIITSKFIPLCAVVDSVARCKILNMKQYNGTFGCTFCEHPTKRVDNCRKYPISAIVPKDRTSDSLKNQMLRAAESKYGNDFKGVWGPSPLMNMNHFDLVNGMSPDYMHAILLGVTKQHTDILLSSFGKEYYVGSPNQLEVINSILTSFKHPTCITRSPRSIIEREMWKASEWRSWLLFYSLICLKPILPHKYLDHLALLVEAMAILLSEELTYEELELADSLLIRYEVLYQDYFGEQAMTYNLHLLIHMRKSVLNLGPLRCHNTFIFENENHFLLKLRKSPTNICVQIARRYLFQKSLPLLQNTIDVSDEFLKFCERNMTGHLKYTSDVGGCLLIGKGKEYCLNDRELQILNRQEKCKSFNRFIYNRIRYTSKSYRMCERINDSIAILKNGKIGIIKNICYFDVNKDDKIIYIFYEEIVKLEKYFHSSRNVAVHHIEECQITENLNVCEAKMISHPCIVKSIEGRNFIISIPVGCYGD